MKDDGVTLYLRINVREYVHMCVYLFIHNHSFIHFVYVGNIKHPEVEEQEGPLANY